MLLFQVSAWTNFYAPLFSHTHYLILLLGQQSFDMSCHVMYVCDTEHLIDYIHTGTGETFYLLWKLSLNVNVTSSKEEYLVGTILTKPVRLHSAGFGPLGPVLNTKGFGYSGSQFTRPNNIHTHAYYGSKQTSVLLWREQ